METAEWIELVNSIKATLGACYPGYPTLSCIMFVGIQVCRFPLEPYPEY